LEESNRKSSKAAVSIIRQLREDLENRTRELISHQLQFASLNKTNLELLAAAHEKDTLLLIKDQLIKEKEGDIANLTRMNVEARENSPIIIANLYFAQAVALEQVASRTQFAPNKKKAARRDAHELYKLALSLGNQNAQVRIADLEGN
jgi:hypothetical protein